MTTVEQHDAEIIARAALFRVHRFYTGGRDGCMADTFDDAQRLAREAKADGYRVLMYAITAEGRSTLVTKERWE